jgi:asparagine synthase (glutamine-hydrolysing)
VPVAGVRAVWCAPGVPVRTVRVLGAGDLAVLGRCPAPQEQLCAALVATARGRWEALTSLPGSYWCVAELDAGGRQIVCGDLAGLRAVFHTGGEDGWAWASRASLLADRIGGGVDAEQMAATMVAGAEHWPTATCYRRVTAVPGGAGLVWRLHTRRAPGTVNTLGALDEVTLAGGAEAVGRALSEAVAWRAEAAGGELAADLSGGLDSSTAVLLAAPRSPDLVAVTYGGPLASAEDAATARRVATHAGVTHHVAQEPACHFQTAPPARTEAPVLASATAALDAAYLSPAAGRRLHLTGHGGDVVLDASSAVWPDLLARGQRRAAHRGVAAAARRRDAAVRPRWQHAREQAALTRAAALRAAAQTVAAAQPPAAPAGWSWVPLGTAVAWLTPAGRRAVAERLEQAADEAPAGELPGAWDDWAALRATATECRDHHPLYTALGINPTHPYLDNTVVRAAFAIPARHRHVEGRPKALLPAALPELPRWLTGRSSKGSFGPMLITGLRRHRTRLRRLLADHPLVAADLVDPVLALAALDSAADGRAGVRLADVHHLLAGALWAASRRAEVA